MSIKDKANYDINTSTIIDSNVLKMKRNSLKGTSANNLSSLLAADEVKSANNAYYFRDKSNEELNSQQYSSKETINSNLKSHLESFYSSSNILQSKSMTLPSKVSHYSPKGSSDLRKSKQSDSSQSSTSVFNSQLFQSSELTSKANPLSSPNNEAKQQSNKESTIIQTYNSIYRACMPYINLLNISQDEIEEIWRIHVALLLNSVSNENSIAIAKASSMNVIETFYLFKKIFKETKRHLNLLFIECCQALFKRTKSFAILEERLSKVFNLINKNIECPTIYFDQDLLITHISANSNQSYMKSPEKSKLTLDIYERHKRITLEISENYQTFMSNKNSLMEVC
jgi:hypothetical protein